MSDDPQKRRPNIEKAEKLLNWIPKVSYETGMEKKITYFYEKLIKQG